MTVRFICSEFLRKEQWDEHKMKNAKAERATETKPPAMDENSVETVSNNFGSATESRKLGFCCFVQIL